MKKRELPSPEFLLDTKKNRISASVSEAESESEESENMSSPTDHDANITLQESDLQKMAGIIQDSFNRDWLNRSRSLLDSKFPTL